MTKKRQYFKNMSHFKALRTFKKGQPLFYHPKGCQCNKCKSKKKGGD